MLGALETQGSSTSIEKISEQVNTDLKLPVEILNIPHKDDPNNSIGLSICI